MSDQPNIDAGNMTSQQMIDNFVHGMPTSDLRARFMEVLVAYHAYDERPEGYDGVQLGCVLPSTGRSLLDDTADDLVSAVGAHVATALAAHPEQAEGAGAVARCTRCGRYEDGARACPNGDAQCPVAQLTDTSAARPDQMTPYGCTVQQLHDVATSVREADDAHDEQVNTLRKLLGEARQRVVDDCHLANRIDVVLSGDTSAARPACKGTNCGATDGISHSPECRAEHDAAADPLNTAGNRNPSERHDGYKGRPLRDNATPDQRAAHAEGVLAAQPASTPDAPSQVKLSTVLQAIQAVNAEATRRGSMFPQASDEQADDRAAVRRVIGMLEWYVKEGKPSQIHGWPLATTQPVEKVPSEQEIAAAEVASWPQAIQDAAKVTGVLSSDPRQRAAALAARTSEGDKP